MLMYEVCFFLFFKPFRKVLTMIVTIFVTKNNTGKLYSVNDIQCTTSPMDHDPYIYTGIYKYTYSVMFKSI